MFSTLRDLSPLDPTRSIRDAYGEQDPEETGDYRTPRAGERA